MYPLNHHWLSISATNLRYGVFSAMRGESLAAPCFKLRLLWHWLSSVFVRERNNLHASHRVESVTSDGMKGAARRNAALHKSGRRASKQRATTLRRTFRRWGWKACRRWGGEKISCRVNNTTEGVRERTVTRNPAGVGEGTEKRAMTELMRNKEWAQPQGCMSSASVLPDSIISPIGGSLVCCPTYWFKCVCDGELR